MHSLWHPLSSLVIPELKTFATPGLLRMLLKTQSRPELAYAGDAMWPSIVHGQRIALEPLEGGGVCRGMVVVTTHEGIPDVLRVDAIEGECVDVIPDAVPSTPIRTSRDDIIAKLSLSAHVPGTTLRAMRRLWLDLQEALTDDAGADEAASVAFKYESQAPFYAQTVSRDIDPSLLRRIAGHVPGGGRILVVGSGNGYDCIALARRGYEIVGIDFSPAMVDLARKEVERQGVHADIRLVDARDHQEPQGTLDAVLFTHEVYSFIPTIRIRVDTLRRMRSWLKPQAVIFLSARVAWRRYDRLLLSLHWLFHDARSGHEWGHSHTRWISPDGSMNRSFLQLLTVRRLRKECLLAGLIPGPFESGYATLIPTTKGKA